MPKPMRGMRPPISVQRRAGLQAPQVVPKVIWDGLVPPENQAAFAHVLLTPTGKRLAARWHGETLYHAAGGHWWIEGMESARAPHRLSSEGFGYGGPLIEGRAGGSVGS